MCTRYITPTDADIERIWRIRPIDAWPAREVFPRAPGVFIRRADDAAEVVVGQWALIPWFAKQPLLPYSTNNARYEEITAKASYKQPWARGQRCIIPPASFDEPCWETGRNVWWRFRRVDREPWGLAGLWNTWVDQGTGEVHESYTMLTINADAHPLMNRMHKPDPNYGPDEQDKRSIVAIERDDVEQWLQGTEQEARALARLTPAEAFDAAPVPAAKPLSGRRRADTGR